MGLCRAGVPPLPTAAQSLDKLPDFLAPDLPPGVENLCAGVIVPDLPPGELQAVVSASGELPPLHSWCDGTCTIDITFVYDPALRNSWDGLNGDTVPYSIGRFPKDIAAAIQFANVAFVRSNVNDREPLLRRARTGGAGPRAR